MLYKNSKAILRSPDGDTDLFQIEAGVLQGDTLAPYLFIICLDYALRISADKDNDLGITLTKRKSTRHPAKTKNFSHSQLNKHVVYFVPNECNFPTHICMTSVRNTCESFFPRF